jgi:hypothetical protein
MLGRCCPQLDSCDSLQSGQYALTSRRLDDDDPGVNGSSRWVRWVLVVVAISVIAIAGMAITGWVVVGTSHNVGSRRFAVTVTNDRSDAVAVQPCGRYFCNNFRPVDLRPGGSFTWGTNDGDAGIHSFVVAAPAGRILGCLGQGDSGQVAKAVALRVTDFRECVT